LTKLIAGDDGGDKFSSTLMKGSTTNWSWGSSALSAASRSLTNQLARATGASDHKKVDGEIDDVEARSLLAGSDPR
jgi:uncharacterized protein with von Willebrand factor type A (vWA) domain